MILGVDCFACLIPKDGVYTESIEWHEAYIPLERRNSRPVAAHGDIRKHLQGSKIGGQRFNCGPDTI